MDNTLTLADAGSLAAILHAAQRKSVVGRLAPDGQSALIGHATFIGNPGLPERNWAAEAAADVRDLYLAVRPLSAAGAVYLYWRIGQLLAESPSGWFIADFDVAAFEAAGGQATVPASVTAWKTSLPGRPPCQQDNADLRNWPAADLLRLARAAGQLWHSTGGSDPYDVLDDEQRTLFDRAAASYLTTKPEIPAAVQPAGAGAMPFQHGEVVEYLRAAASPALRAWMPAVFDGYVTSSSHHVYVRKLTEANPVLSRLSEVRRIPPELIRAARSWIADCEWGEDDLDVAALSDSDVVRGVQKHFIDGWLAFRAAEDLTPAVYPAIAYVYDLRDGLAGALTVYCAEQWAALAARQPAGYEVRPAGPR